MTYHKRLANLQRHLHNASIDAIIIEDKINLYYLTGLDLSAGMLLAHSRGATLYVDSRYYELCRKVSPYPVEQTDSKNPLSLIQNTELSFIKKLGFDSDTTSYNRFEQITKLLKSQNTYIDLIPIDAPVKWLRMIKDDSEIIALRESAALGSQGFDFLCSLLKEGITEEECAQELEVFWKRKGSKAVAFDPIIAFGPNSSMPHYRAGKAPLKNGQIALLDIGVNYKNYHSDMTRIAFFGNPDPTLLAIHAIVQKAQKAALSVCRPGTTIEALDSAARDVIASHGYAEQFTHSLGHGVGLEIHELPTIRNSPQFGKMSLSSGMVITIEPGIYLPNIGGVRIEDTVVITENGHENLTMRNTDPVLL